MRKIFSFGHRGSPLERPENTLPSFERALELGADGVELDVQRTKDGHLVIFHDSTLERTTTGSGPLAEKTLAELKELDAGSWFGERYQALKILTFREALIFLRNRGLALIDVKDAGLGEQIAREVEEERMGEAAILTTSRREVALELRRANLYLPVRAWAPWQGLEQVSAKELDEALRWNIAMGIRFMAVNMDHLTERMVETCHRRGLLVWASGGAGEDRSPEEIRYAIQLGVDGLITDVPGRVAQVIREIAG